MNTLITLAYCDADNYKASTEVVVAGELTGELRSRLERAIAGGENGSFVICHQVGLPTPSTQFIGRDGFPNDEIDHVWSTIEEVERGQPFQLTDVQPTVSVSAEELVARFEFAAPKWDVAAECERMQRSYSDNDCNFSYTP